MTERKLAPAIFAVTEKNMPEIAVMAVIVNLGSIAKATNVLVPKSEKPTANLAVKILTVKASIVFIEFVALPLPTAETYIVTREKPVPPADRTAELA